ncbi:hypothetical protein WH87_13020 [Devosia epidermidihirudinis]|uniref:Diguanylate cyclase n=1 Tax=Devosia epidermidihirudinis TaxID=1293439 RepID=A0A0F5Q8Y2_9HYPH|nr:EAL domain-containing protein [Devosia epidermidihirudinis]KKC37437.1 hypothetical protein WH87_13020 [Devosia epidermidihirudinis]
MQTSSSTHERWPFSAAILLPVVLALTITAAAVLGYIMWSTSTIDERALQRQRVMLTEVLKTKQARARLDIENVAIWDEAVLNTKISFNFNWVDSTLGRWLHDVFGQSATVLLDASNTPLYVMREGVNAPAASFTSMANAIVPLANRIRLRNAGQTGMYGEDRPRGISDISVVDGVPSIVSVMSIISSSGAYPQTAGSEFVIAAAISLDEALADELSRDYLFENGRFTLIPSNLPERATFSVRDNAGHFVAYFEWEHDQPGTLMLRQTAPAMLVAFLMAAILVALLLIQLKRSSAAIDSARRHAEHQAAHDQLTGLPNRSSFDRHLQQALLNRQAGGAQISLMMLDLDRFKHVNDTLGHQAGDALINEVGQRIRMVVGPHVMIARLGGDEFGILTSPRGPSIDVPALSANIIEAIRRPFEINKFHAHVGASIGIATTRSDGTDPRELVRKADIALYEAKAAGRNRAVQFEEQMHELLQLQHTIEGELREALRRHDQLSVVFQPLIDQKSRKVIGAEALVRWNHPKFGYISPTRFIPIAESTGMIEALGEFVLLRACELGATAPGRTIAVNISPTQLRNPNFSSTVFDVLHQTGMRPTDLELEITESILLDDEHISSQNLRTFRDAGIHIALDDFGTGYSSLSYLKRYPVDRIKIDRSFVSQLAEGHVSVAITQAIVTLAHAMDIQVTAEGVETEKQAEILGAMGCNTLQGYLFSPGTSPAHIIEIFSEAANKPQRRHSVVS